MRKWLVRSMVFFSILVLQNVLGNFSTSTDIKDLLKLQNYLWNNTSHNNTFDPFHESDSCPLRLPVHFKKTLSIPPGPNIPLDRDGNRHAALLQTLCLELNSFGNVLGYYIEARLCALISGTHYVSIRKVSTSTEVHTHSPILEMLPTISLHKTPNTSYSILNIKRECLCEYDDCHEHAEALYYRFHELATNMYAYAYEKVLFNIRTSQGFHLLIDKKKILRLKLSLIEKKLPFIPDVSIHYRCGDNVGAGYGVLPYRAFTTKIPKETTRTIYIMGEEKYRKTHKKSADLCEAIIIRLFDTLVTHFPNATVLVLRGGNITHDQLRLAFSNVTICSASTFCIWPAMINKNTVYFPLTSLIANREKPQLSPRFFWFNDPPVVNNFLKIKNIWKILTAGT